MRVIDRNDHSFGRLWDALWQQDVYQFPLYSNLHSDYYKSYWNYKQFSDLSFVIADDDGPICGVLMSLSEGRGGRELSAYGLPIYYCEASGLKWSKYQSAYKSLRKKFYSILKDCVPCYLRYEDYLVDGNLSYMGRIFLEHGGVALPKFVQVIDLRADEQELYRRIRRSYRSLISWGTNNLKIIVVDSKTICKEHMVLFRQLHSHVAGRETRSVETWDIQYQMICSGEAFAVFGFSDECMVTAALFLHNEKYCYYGVSASMREYFDKPISHGVLWTAVRHARKLGCSYFELGEQVYALPSKENFQAKKEYNISKFKRGFGGEPHVHLVIELSAHSGDISF